MSLVHVVVSTLATALAPTAIGWAAPPKDQDAKPQQLSPGLVVLLLKQLRPGPRSETPDSAVHSA
jgi:hypothetical protein